MSQFRVMPSLISIHALHEESDFVDDGLVWGGFIFQSTLSMRRATRSFELIGPPKKFQSTLSMRRATGSWWFQAFHPSNFNPRSP